jgi:hypothetical protein
MPRRIWGHPLSVCVALAVGPVPAHGQAPVPRVTGERIASFGEPFSQVRGLRELPTGIVLVTDWTEERLVALDFTRAPWSRIGECRCGARAGRVRRRWPTLRQVTLPAGRRLVGVGRDGLYAVVTDADGLETLERYRVD